MEDKKVLLSIEDLKVQFHVRGRILTAIRGISLDIYENESIAIVGESGSGKSVFTKTFAGMLDSNGFIGNGNIIFNDDELADTIVDRNSASDSKIASIASKLNELSKYELGADTYQQILNLESEKRAKETVSEEEKAEEEATLTELRHEKTDMFNRKQVLDPKKDKAEIKKAAAREKELEQEIAKLEKQYAAKEKARKAAVAADSAYLAEYNSKMSELKTKHAGEITGSISDAVKSRNEIIAKEIYISTARFGSRKRSKCVKNLIEAFKKAMMIGVDLADETQLNQIFDTVTFRVRFLDETSDKYHGTCILNLAKIQDARDWGQIRGRRIATVFQDPMTSLNPIITIGKQITSIIIKHQGCTEYEARKRAIELMYKVGIPKPETRFDDYPFQYSGGMRQRIVIAIALSCQPKILICDEPTTALDVTIQAQILQLLKDLQKELNFTIVFITHDLGVVANIADRVAVLYGGQIVELGEVEEVFYDPRHPYTWALLSSLPQLAQRNTELFSITGTPPSLYNEIVGDAFAPRNPHCLKVDTLKEPPMFKVTDTHYAKTWLLDPRAPKVEKPEAIADIHGKLLEAFNI